MKAFLSDDRGAMTIYLLVTVILLVGMVGIVLDSTRTYVAHTNMQDYVDDLALAAASELDGQPGAVARAKAVLDSALTEAQTTIPLADGAESHQSNYYILNSEPVASGSRMSLQGVQAAQTLSDEDATHVVVVSAPELVGWGWLQAWTMGDLPDGPTNAFTVRTWASARLTEANYCTEPLFVMCAPAGADFDTLNPGTQIDLVENNDDVWEEGEYGIVSDISDDADGTCSGYSGYEQMECLLAIDSHMTQCAPDNTVNFTADPRQVVQIDNNGEQVNLTVDAIDVHEAINTRFGIFDDDAGAWADSPNVSIDVNHITARAYQCDGTVSSQAQDYQGPPVDQCFDDGSCSVVGGALLAEDLELYWQIAHGENLPAQDSDGNAIETRYDAYLEEIRLGYVNPASGSAEGPRAACHQQNSSSDTAANRRVYQMAVIDCSQLTDGVMQTDIEVDQYIEVFLQEPVDGGDYFTADFDGTVTWEDSDGNEQVVTMGAGDVIDSDAVSTLSASIDSPTGFYDPYEQQGMYISALANNRENNNGSTSDGQNAAMIFDSANYTGRDSDLQSVDMGNIVIISEDGDPTDPDDHALGGMLIFQYDTPRDVHAIRFFDGEEHDNQVLFFNDFIDVPAVAALLDAHPNAEEMYAALTTVAGDDPDLVMDVPFIGDGAHLQMPISTSTEYSTAQADGDINPLGVQTVIYWMKSGSGAVDEIIFDADPVDYDNMTVELLNVLDDNDRQISRYPVLTD